MELRLRDLVEILKGELSEERDTEPLFQVDKASVKTAVAIRKSTTGELGFSAWVIETTGTRESEDESVHEVTIELTPIRDLLLGED